MIRLSDKVKSISIWYANLNGYALPLSPEQLLNAVVAWVDEYGGDHIYFDNPPVGTEVNVGDIKISTATWEVQQWNGREWESLGSIAGVAATIEIGEVDTLEPGQPATVENTGSEFAAVLKFGIPKGDKGDKGDKGEQGERGEQGEQGVKGEQGERGEQGEQGVQGIQGDKGDAATVTVGKTTTLPAGSSATVENVGTTSAAVLEFGIPRGETGQTGQVVFDIINISGSGAISSDNLAKIASSPEGVALVDENNYRYKISRSDGTNYIFTADNIDGGDIQLYVVTVNATSGAYSRSSAEASSPVPSFTADTNENVTPSENGFNFIPSKMNFGAEVYGVSANLPISAGSGINMDIDESGKSVKISVDQNETSTEVELSGASGTIEDGVLQILQRDNPTAYIKNDNEIYYYSDNMSDSGYLVYTHVGMINNTYYVKTITIQISAKTWTKTQQQIGNFSDRGNYPNVSVGTATNATNAGSASTATNATNATNDELGRNIVNTYVLKGEEGWGLVLYACTISFSATAAIYFCYPNNYFSFDIDYIANDLYRKGMGSISQAFPVAGIVPDGGQVVGMYSKDGSSITLAVITGAQLTEMALPNGTLNKSAYV